MSAIPSRQYRVIVVETVTRIVTLAAASRDAAARRARKLRDRGDQSLAIKGSCIDDVIIDELSR